MTYISAESISKTYHREQPVEALRDTNVSVDRGEIACIVGSSGCGKSTFLRIIAGLTPPTSGNMVIDGGRVTGLPDEIGFVFQDFENTLLKWKTVRDNVRVGAKLGEVPEHEARTDECLQLVGLAGFADAYPMELSGGMRQRVQVARNIAYGPNILLCDEPFGALDAQTKEELQNEFLNLIDTGQIDTVIFVTHDISEAIYLGDVVHIFTSKNPGNIGRSIEIDFERPRFPRREFEAKYTDEIVELEDEVRTSMEL